MVCGRCKFVQSIDALASIRRHNGHKNTEIKGRKEKAGTGLASYCITLSLENTILVVYAPAPVQVAASHVTLPVVVQMQRENYDTPCCPPCQAPRAAGVYVRRALICLDLSTRRKVTEKRASTNQTSSRLSWHDLFAADFF